MKKETVFLSKWIVCILMLFLGCLLFPEPLITAHAEVNEESEPRFGIHSIRVNGNTLIGNEALEKVTKKFVGAGKTSKDVEQARNQVESVYHQAGYPAVLVNIPEQTVDDGNVVLDVVESRIRDIRVEGNRYFTMQRLLKKLPAFAPGEVLYLPDAKRQLILANRNPDLSVTPSLMPGKIPGTIDVTLKVRDNMPLHGSLELNNQSGHDTTELRLNGIIHYDNLWQQEHSMSLQYQTSPEDTEEVNAASLSYLLYTPWHESHMMALYAIYSDSDMAFGDGFKVSGRGNIYGFRYVIPFEARNNFSHSVTMGIDHKEFKDILNYMVEIEKEQEEEVVKTPITYSPLSFSYQLSLMNGKALTVFSSGVDLAVRRLSIDTREFDDKRFKSRGSYLKLSIGIEHKQPLPFGTALDLKALGQISDQAMISTEQFSVGGMTTVRGYKESEQLGDNGVRFSTELKSPNMFRLFSDSIAKKFVTTPYLFYDVAALRSYDLLPEEEQPELMHGSGIGISGKITRLFTYRIDWATALADTEQTKKGTRLVYFRGKAIF